MIANGRLQPRENMRLNPTRSRFFTKHSEMFDKAYAQLVATYVDLRDAFFLLDDELRRTPYSVGEPTDIFPNRQFFLALTPRTVRHPGLRVLYEVEDPRVVCWHVGERARRDASPVSATIHVLARK